MFMGYSAINSTHMHSKNQSKQTTSLSISVSFLHVWSPSVPVFSSSYPVYYIIVNYNCPTKLWNTRTCYFCVLAPIIQPPLSLVPCPSQPLIITILNADQLGFFNIHKWKKNMVLFFCVWLISLSVKISSFIHFAAQVRISFFNGF